MAQSETVERILDAAEQLFAERGFAETSLRLITSKAGVNLAAVNYHFGSKKALIQAVFSRFLGPFCASLERELERRQAKPEHKPSLEELLEMLVEQALAVQPRSNNDLSIFMRLLGLAFSQSQGHLRRYLEDMYGKVFRRYMLLVNEAAPRIPPLGCSGACTSCWVPPPSACPVSRRCEQLPRLTLASTPRSSR
ncbi:hypothetical protein DBADOPDK_02018 [Pseudomonas sp. MM223]|nr:hypothetical protein DBADOPDK_02018 [Pseudomonas sp. MM223]